MEKIINQFCFCITNNFCQFILISFFYFFQTDLKPPAGLPFSIKPKDQILD